MKNEDIEKLTCDFYAAAESGDKTAFKSVLEKIKHDSDLASRVISGTPERRVWYTLLSQYADTKDVKFLEMFNLWLSYSPDLSLRAKIFQPLNSLTFNVTPLYHALKLKLIGVAEELLKRGCDPNDGGDASGIPLWHAVNEMFPNMVELLLLKGASTRGGDFDPLRRAVVMLQNDLRMDFGNRVEIISMIRALVLWGADTTAIQDISHRRVSLDQIATESGLLELISL